MRTHGYISFAPYIFGQLKENQWPGYRADFTTSIDLFKYNHLVLYGTVGNTTLISISNTSIFTLDKLHYNLSANLRYEFDNLMVKGGYDRGSIYKVGTTETGTPVWWNAINLGAGTPGAYNLYLRNIYKDKEQEFINDWDAQINFSTYLKPTGTVYTGINHHYNYNINTLIRYHIGVYQNWAVFVGISNNIWFIKNESSEQKAAVTFNVFRKKAVNFSGFYFTYVVFDTYTPDNENKLGAIGFRIIF